MDAQPPGGLRLRIRRLGLGLLDIGEYPFASVEIALARLGQRVLRLSRRVRKCDSSSETARDAMAVVMFRREAAPVKLPSSAMRANIRIMCSVSIVCFPRINPYWAPWVRVLPEGSKAPNYLVEARPVQHETHFVDRSIYETPGAKALTQPAKLSKCPTNAAGVPAWRHVPTVSLPSRQRAGFPVAHRRQHTV
jgi:hypothetical protein